MDPIFEKLSPTEYQSLKEAIPLITILIAGADGNIDEKETNWAQKVTNIRAYSTPEHYQSYYEEVGDTFAERLSALISELPADVQERSQAVSDRLAELNTILEKLSPKVAAAMYKEFRTFANHVARASGGFLKFWSISAAEKKWVSLPMLRKFEWDEEEEE
ncbi:MAG: hypothetical protein R3301_13125 [Saprospiraceae bacterium]|nr:hypothetical protein [Saprospiraceae bacterium]